MLTFPLPPDDGPRTKEVAMRRTLMPSVGFRRFIFVAVFSLTMIELGCETDCDPDISSNTCCCMTGLGYTSINKDTCNKNGGHCTTDNMCASSSSLIDPDGIILVRPKKTLHLVAFSAPTAVESCFAHCPAGITNADCAAGKIDKATSDSITQLRTWAISNTKREIQPKELMDLFHQTTPDPCHRGTTKLSSTGVSNEGDECALEAPLTKLEVRAHLMIPAKLKANWDPRFPTSKLLIVGAPAPNLHFLKTDKNEFAPLDADFGGDILWIETSDTRFMVRTSNHGCVGIDY